jgi:hypothetical protein
MLKTKLTLSCLAFLCVAGVGSASGAVIPLDNYSFESPVIGGYQAGIVDWIPGGTGQTGTFNNDFNSTTDGENVQLLITGSVGDYVHIRQEIPTTTTTITGNTQYTLDFLAGIRAGFSALPGTWNPRLQAFDGSTYTDLTPSSETGSFGTPGTLSQWSSVFDVAADSPLVGQQLVVRFDMTQTGSTGTQVGLDKVQLVPEPATMSLIALGGLLLARKRR